METLPIALQFSEVLRPDIIWILIPLTALAIPIVAIALEPLKTRQKLAEKREVRALYERLAMEKLDVLKTAIAMGYRDDELAELDRRLEKLVGTDKMKNVIEGKSKVEIVAADLSKGLGEIARAVEGRIAVKD